MGKYIDVKKLSTWLDLKLATAYKMAESGQIPSVKIGKLRRFHVPTIEKWLEGCREG